MTRFVPDDVRIERRLRRSSSIPHRGRTFRAITRALIAILVWTALPADAVADLSVQTRIPLAEWHAALRQEMAIEYRCVKPTKPEAASPPGRRRAPADITPRQMLISRKPALTTLPEALEQGYVCEEIPRSRRMLVSWESDSMTPRERVEIAKPRNFGLSPDGKARIPIQAWKAAFPESDLEIRDMDASTELREGVEHSTIGGDDLNVVSNRQRDIERVVVAAVMFDGEIHSVGGEAADVDEIDGSALENLAGVKKSGVRDSFLEEGGTEGVAEFGKRRDRHTKFYGANAKCVVDRFGLRDVLLIVNEPLERYGCVDDNAHVLGLSVAQISEMSKSAGKCPVLRLDLSTQDIHLSEERVLGLGGRRLGHQLVNEGLDLLLLGGGQGGDLFYQGGRAHLTVPVVADRTSVVVEVPTPDPSRRERTTGRGSCHVCGASTAIEDRRDGRLTAEVEGLLSSPSAPSSNTSLGNVLDKLLGDDFHAGHTLKMEANRDAKFSKEVDVRFPLPDFTKVPAEQRPPTPKDAFYMIHKRSLVCPDGGASCPENTKIIVFEIVDEAKVQCKAKPSANGPAEVPTTCDPEKLEIVTASPPFTGLISTVFTEILFLSWALPTPASRFGMPVHGLIRGRVTRQVYERGQVVSRPVVGAIVSGVDPAVIDPATNLPRPLVMIEGEQSTITNQDGDYGLTDWRYTGGPVEIVARMEDGRTTRAKGFEVTPSALKFGRFPVEAVVNLNFAATEAPPVIPDVSITLVRANSLAVNLGGLAPLGVPLQIGIRSNVEGEELTYTSGVDINGVNYALQVDPSGRYHQILNAPFEPSTVGSYRITGTALRPLGGTVEFGETIRIVGAGGGIETDNANPPRVIDARTAPKKNAKNVSVSSFVSLSFTEPVTGILPNLQFTSPQGDVPFKATGVRPNGTVIEDLASAPSEIVTSVTLQPLNGLKFATKYTIKALAGIQDLDAGEPKSLVPYETSFDTFGPESINPESPDVYSTGGFVILKNDELVTGWTLKHLMSSSTWRGLLIGYDATDPSNLTELSSKTIENRVIDIAGEGSEVVVANGTNHKSRPGALLVYDIADPENPQWVGAATLSTGATDGTPSRIAVRNGKVYAATFKKGIQIATLEGLKTNFSAGLASAAIAFEGKSYNQLAVTTIDLPTPGSAAMPWMRDISAVQIDSDTIIAVATSFGLALVSEGASAPLFRGHLPKNSPTTTFIYAAEATILDNRPVVIVAAMTGGTTPRTVLMVVDISIPGNPIVLGSAPLTTQDLVPVDIEVSEGKAFVGFESPTAPKFEVVQISNPTSPIPAGVIEGVGGRLQVLDGVIYGASYGYATAGVKGGIRTAALATLALIDGTNPGTVVVGDGPRAAEAFQLKYRVVPSSTEVTSSHIDYVVGANVLQGPIPVPMGALGRGQTPVAFGFTFPKQGEVVAKARLSIVTADGEEVIGRPRALLTEQPTVEVEFDDEQEESVIADQPSVLVNVTSPEWLRRADEAAERNEEAPTKDLTFEAVLPPATMTPTAQSANDGIFESTMGLSTQAGQTRLGKAYIGDVLLGQSELVLLEPGVASEATSTLTTSRAALPADDGSETILTLTVKDQHGNFVADGTPVVWEKGEGADGEFVQAQEGTSTGQATVRYRAGVNPGPVRINAHVDDALLTVTLSQAQLGVVMTVPTIRSFFDKTALPIEVQLSSSAGPVADNAPVVWFSSTGRISPSQPVTGGIARATWDPTQTTWRPRVDFAVIVGQGRAQRKMTWSRTAPTADASTASPVRVASLHSAGYAPLAYQAGSEPRHASISPAFVAGDLVSDQSVAWEKADGTVEMVPVKAVATYQVYGLVPNERVSVELGTNRSPNLAPIVHLTGDEKEGNVIPDATGMHDGEALSGVRLSQNGYKAGAFTFGTTGIGPGDISGIAIDHGPDFAFTGGFMVQAAVRPPPPGTGIGQSNLGAGTLIKKGTGFSLDLVEVDGSLRARFTIETLLGPEFITSSVPIARNEWSLVTAKYDSARIYVGLENDLESMFVSGAPVLGFDPIAIGPGLTGDLDEIRIFDLTKNVLSTFPNGQQSLSIVADATGEYSSPILPTGALASPQVAAYYQKVSRGVRIASLRGGESYLSEFQEPGASSETELAITLIETRTYWEDRAESSTDQVGFVAAKTMVFFAKLGQSVFAGSGGAGDPPDPVLMAGDFLGSFFLAPITIARDVANSTDRLIRGSANGQDGLDLALGVVTVGASLVKGKAGALLKLGTLAKSLPTGSKSSKVVARLIAAEAALEAGATGVSRIKKIVEVANYSAAAATIVGGILDVIGDDDDKVAHLNNVLEDSDDPVDTLSALDGTRNDGDAKDFGHFISALGEPATGAPAADLPILRFKPKKNRLMVEGLNAGRRAVRAAKGPATTGAAGAAIQQVTKQLAKDGVDAETVAKVADNMRRVSSKTKTLHKAVSNVKHPLKNKRLSAIGQLDDGADLVAGLKGDEEVAFEFFQRIKGDGKNFKRFYDSVVVNKDSGVLVRFRESATLSSLKRFPPGDSDRIWSSLDGKLRQMTRDIVQHKKEFLNGNVGKYVIRVPTDLTGPDRDKLLKYWKDRLTSKNRFMKKHWLKDLPADERENTAKLLDGLDPSKWVEWIVLK